MYETISIGRSATQRDSVINNDGAYVYSTDPAICTERM